MNTPATTAQEVVADPDRFADLIDRAATDPERLLSALRAVLRLGHTFGKRAALAGRIAEARTGAADGSPFRDGEYMRASAEQTACTEAGRLLKEAIAAGLLAGEPAGPPPPGSVERIADAIEAVLNDQFGAGADPGRVLTRALAAVIQGEAAQRFTDRLAARALLRSTDLRSGARMDLRDAEELAVELYAMARTFVGDANYAETDLGVLAGETELGLAGERDRYLLTIQREGALTPHEGRRAAEDRAQAAEAELARLTQSIATAGQGPAELAMLLVDVIINDQPFWDRTVDTCQEMIAANRGVWADWAQAGDDDPEITNLLGRVVRRLVVEEFQLRGVRPLTGLKYVTDYMLSAWLERLDWPLIGADVLARLRSEHRHQAATAQPGQGR